MSMLSRKYEGVTNDNIFNPFVYKTALKMVKRKNVDVYWCVNVSLLEELYECKKDHTLVEV